MRAILAVAAFLLFGCGNAQVAVGGEDDLPLAHLTMEWAQKAVVEAQGMHLDEIAGVYSVFAKSDREPWRILDGLRDEIPVFMIRPDGFCFGHKFPIDSGLVSVYEDGLLVRADGNIDRLIVYRYSIAGNMLCLSAVGAIEVKPFNPRTVPTITGVRDFTSTSEYILLRR